MALDDVLAESCLSAVRLTRFSILDVADNRFDLSCVPSKQQSYQASKASTSEKTSSNRDNTLDIIKNVEKFNQENHHEENYPFKIVWKNLSYTVRDNPLTIANITFNLKAWATSKRSHNGNCLDDHDKTVKGQSIFSQQRNILINVNGQIESGKITALLGPSGAGKTSLLNALTVSRDGLSGRVEVIPDTRSSLSGDSLQHSSKKRRKFKISFIPQKDHLIDTLTVKENLMFASQIKNSRLAGIDHESNVAKIVDTLKLNHCVHRITGKLSGGEHKRLSIGQELLSRPDVLVLDEPTSGLDSLSCKKLIMFLKALLQSQTQANKQEEEEQAKPLSIVMTVHQPGVDVFQMFDRVYFMASQGRIIYDGEPNMAMSTIEKISGIVPVESQSSPSSRLFNCNPASYLMEIASGEFGQEPIERLAEYQRFCFHNQQEQQLEETVSTNNNQQVSGDKFNSGPNYNALNELNAKTESNNLELHNNGSLYKDSRLGSNIDHSGQFFNHLKLLTKRTLISTWREPLITQTSLIFYLMLPLISYTIYSSMGGEVNLCPVLIRQIDMLTVISNDTSNYLLEYGGNLRIALDNMTMLFMNMVSMITCTMSVSALMFPMTMHIFMKEYRNGWYSTTTYSLARFLANLPYETVMPVTSMILIYYALNQAKSYMEWRMLAMVITIALTSMIASAHGRLHGVLFMDSIQTAVFVSLATTLLLQFTTGFFVRLSGQPYWLQIVCSTTYFRQAFMALVSVRFGFGKCPCDQQLDQYIKATKPGLIMPKQIKSLVAFYSEQQGGNNFTVDSLDKSIQTLARSFSNGQDITSCKQMKSDMLQKLSLEGDELLGALANLVGTLILIHILLIFVIKWTIQKRV